jgi:hypothetical protein
MWGVRYESKELKLAAAYFTQTKTFDITQKFWTYNDGVVAWELRRFVWELHSDRQKVEVNKVLKLIGKEVRSRFELIGMRFDDELFPSRKAAACKGEEAVLSPYTRDEYSMRTRGFLMMMICRLCDLKKPEQASFVCKFLERFFDMALQIPSSAQCIAVLGSELDKCAEDVDEDGLCAHMLTVLTDSRIDASQDSNVGMIVQLVKSLCLHAVECPAAEACLRRFLSKFATSIDTKVLDESQAYNVMADRLLLSQTRANVRCDEDFKLHAVRTAVSNGDVKSGRDLARALSGSASTVARWEEQDICNYVAAGHRTFEKARTFCFAEDGKRLGDLKRENLLFEMWSPDPDRGMYLAPQERFFLQCIGNSYGL